MATVLIRMAWSIMTAMSTTPPPQSVPRPRSGQRVANRAHRASSGTVHYQGGRDSRRCDGKIDSASDDIRLYRHGHQYRQRTLTNVVVTDPLAITVANPTGQIGTIASLAVGASQSFSFTYDVKQAVIDGNGIDKNGVVDGDGDVDNTASAVSTQTPIPVSASQTVLIEQAPALSITKAAAIPGDADGKIDSASDDISIPSRSPTPATRP